MVIPGPRLSRKPSLSGTLDTYLRPGGGLWGVLGLQTLVGRHWDSNPGPPACESGVIAITLRGPPLQKKFIPWWSATTTATAASEKGKLKWFFQIWTKRKRKKEKKLPKKQGKGERDASARTLAIFEKKNGKTRNSSRKEGKRKWAKLCRTIFFVRALLRYRFYCYRHAKGGRRRRNIGGKDMRALPAFFSFENMFF